MVLLDYSQVELRLTAHHSQDPTLIAAYPWHAPAQDVHSITCAEVVMDMSLDNFMAIYGDESHPEYEEYKWFRNIAKRVNFGIIYGAGPGAIQRQVSTPQRQVSRDECQEYIDKYLQKYVGVKEWIDRTQFALERYGFLQNTFGRFRRLPDAKSKERWKQGRAGRQGVNFLIQGDAADLFKHAAVRVRKVLQDANARTKIVNFVHDEIQLYWHREELHLLPAVKAAMEDFSQYSVPIVVDIEVAQYDWAHRKSVHV
jgi:DNA polymerase-1